MCVWRYIHICMYIHAYKYTYLYVHTHMCACMHAYSYIYVYIYMYVCTILSKSIHAFSTVNTKKEDKERWQGWSGELGTETLENVDFLLLVGQEEWDNDCGFSNAIIAAPRSPTLVSAEIVANLVFWSSGMRTMQGDGCTANLERLLTMLSSALHSGCFLHYEDDCCTHASHISTGKYKK